MPIKKQFRVATDNIIASYSFEDIIEGTGVVRFEGFIEGQDSSAGANSETITYNLSSNANYSKKEIAVNTITGGEFHANFSVSSTTYTAGTIFNFDLSPLVFPRTISGTSKISFTTGVRRTGGAAKNFQGYWKVSLIKYSNAVETSLGSFFTMPLIGPSTGTAYTNVNQVVSKMSIAKTSFIIGDVLRLKFESFARNAEDASTITGNVTICVQPQNLIVSEGSQTIADPSVSPFFTTRLLLDIPFAIEL